MARLSPARRKKVEARTAALIAEEQSLRDLRHALATEARRQSMAAARDERRKLKGAAGFPVTRRVPNAATPKAIDQLEKGKGRRSSSRVRRRLPLLKS